jgi:hypothetical protein
MEEGRTACEITGVKKQEKIERASSAASSTSTSKTTTTA